MSEASTSLLSPRLQISNNNYHITRLIRAHPQIQIIFCRQTHSKSALILATIYGHHRLQLLHNTNIIIKLNSCSQPSRTTLCLKIKTSRLITFHFIKRSRHLLHLISSTTMTVLSSKAMSGLYKIKYLICRANCAL